MTPLDQARADLAAFDLIGGQPDPMKLVRHLRAALAEVDRLSAHRELCTANLLRGYTTGKDEERAAVVAWLRAQAYDNAARSIERRIHLEPK